MLSEETSALAKGNNYAFLATIMADGRPQVTPVWIDADDDHLLVNTELHRVKSNNLRRDPRVTVSILDMTNPYRYVQVFGRMVQEVTGPEARAHIDALSQKYLGRDYDEGNIRTERVIYKILPSNSSQRS